MRVRAVAGTLIVRADAGPDIGSGHLVRSLALAEAWQTLGGHVVLVTTRPDAAPAGSRLKGIEVVPVGAPHPDPGDAEVVEALIARHPNAWVVCDGYHFDAEYLRRARQAGARVLVIDDYAHAPVYAADVLLNQNLGAEGLSYSFERPPVCLFGPRYALLRRSFTSRGQRRDEAPASVSCLLVTLGGGDAIHVLETIIRACARVKVRPVRVVVLLGSQSPAPAAIERRPPSPEGMEFEVLRNPADVPATLGRADFAVSASGSTVWELCFLGIPAALVTLAQNQAGIADRLEHAGCAVSLGWHADLDEGRVAATLDRLLLDREARASMSLKGQALVDGRGAERVAGTLMNLPAVAA